MKKLLALLLAVLLALTALAGCTSAEGGKETTTASAKDGTEKDTAEAETTEGESAEAGASGDGFSEHADLKMLFIGPMPLSDEAVTRLSAAISKITEEKFNASVELVSTTFSDFTNKLNMMLATGDQIDIFQPLGELQNYAAQGYLLDMKPYSDLYADAAALVGDYMKGGEIDGAQYCIPNTAQGTTGGDAYFFRKDVYDELDLGSLLKDCKTLPDLEAVLQKIKDNTDYVPLIGTSGDPIARSQGDPINGKMYQGLNNFCYVDPDEPDVVKAYALRDNYKDMADLAWDWAQKGLTGYDEVGNNLELFKAGRMAMVYYGNSPVIEFEGFSVTGMEVEVWQAQLDKPWANTMTGWGYCVPSYCEAPEQAIAVINEFFINPDLTNILEWGEENVDYVVVDQEKGLVSFPEGMHMGNVGFYNYVKDSVANQFITYESVNEEGYHKLQQEFQKNGVNPSPYIGFSFDASNVVNEISACTNVNDKYVSGLINGLLDPEENFQQYIDELKANGIQNIIDETQRQLDAWLQENK